MCTYRCKKLEVEDSELNTPLLMAAAEGSSDTMHFLIEKGAELTRTDGKGNNIVHLMVSSDNANVLKVSGSLNTARLRNVKNTTCLIMKIKDASLIYCRRYAHMLMAI